jgi:hypothetical protein
MNFIKAFSLCFLAVLGTIGLAPAARAQEYRSLLKSKEWVANAEAIIKLHKANSEDTDFIKQFDALNEKLVDAHDDEDTSDADGIKYLVILYFNNKLEHQYVTDKRSSLGDSFFFAKTRDCVAFNQKLLGVMSRANRQLERMLAKEWPFFRDSFGDYEELRLRTYP